MITADETLSQPTTAPRSYWRETQQPIYSAALILPFALVYEIGVWLVRSPYINGGDAIISTLFRRFVEAVGVGAGSASVIVLIGLFIGCQIYRRAGWRLDGARLLGTLVESLLYAVLLFVLMKSALQYLPRSGSVSVPAVVAAAAGSENSPQPTQLVPCRRDGVQRPGLQDFVLYCGAGVYEELVFRVMLLALLMLVFTKLFHLEHAHAAVWSVLLGAVIFSAFHHIGPSGDPFSWGRFMQRAIAALYFSAIYMNRSFGIAAATHALYDILIGLTAWVQ